LEKFFPDYEIIEWNESNYDVNKKRAVTDIQSIKSNQFDIHKYQGSKYIQSDFSNVFDTILSSNEGVITGTPCQISALHNFLLLHNVRDKYLLVDLICHGVPTNLLWNKYIKEKEHQLGSNESMDVLFRDKSFGWRDKIITLVTSKQYLHINEKKDLFYVFFLAANCYAESCYECNYRCSSNADIRIGDYWGKKYYGEKMGMSMVLPLTAKGFSELQILKNKKAITIENGSVNDYFKSQQTKNHYKPLEYSKIISDFKSTSTLTQMRKKYCKTFIFKQKIKPFIKIMSLFLHRKGE